LTSEQRKHVENGIWLCQTHAKLIDNDTVRFTVDVLRGWKQMSEQMTQQELDAVTSSGSRDLLGTSGRLTAILLESTEHFDRLSMSGAIGPLELLKPPRSPGSLNIGLVMSLSMRSL
jgi:hypothetical protein